MSQGIAVQEIIPIILARFQAVLQELWDEYAASGEYGEPPTQLFVEHNDGMRDRLTHDEALTQGRWRVTSDRVEGVPSGQPRPSPGERRGMFHERGFGYFSLSEDRRAAWLGWQVGPRYGCGYRYNIVVDEAGLPGLKDEKMTWIS